MDEVPRICHHLAQKGHMSSGDITSLGFAGGREGAVTGYTTIQRCCLMVFEPEAIPFSSWVQQRYH